MRLAHSNAPAAAVPHRLHRHVPIRRRSEHSAVQRVERPMVLPTRQMCLTYRIRMSRDGGLSDLPRHCSCFHMRHTERWRQQKSHDEIRSGRLGQANHPTRMKPRVACARRHTAGQSRNRSKKKLKIQRFYQRSKINRTVAIDRQPDILIKVGNCEIFAIQAGIGIYGVGISSHEN